ncbi:TetR/AcrR family transcriptional regulator [Pseudonocardia sp. GCM10023141]|uniref:TetR/AcrR family transcriptional regulator n=1 Tax=Pseudonocardia sp. GCM10023141 TaxID=3252653 RepID=UPI0036181A3E
MTHGVARRRRGVELEETILEAAWQELADVGYARLTMDGIAARARTGKQVLYRRWRNRAELIVAAMRHNTGSIVEQIPDTGTLRGDVLAMLARMADRYAEIGPDLVHGLVAEIAELDPAMFDVMATAMTAVLAQAAERGEIDLSTISPRVATVPTNLLRLEILMASAPIAEHVLIEIVDEVFLPLVSARR